MRSWIAVVASSALGVSCAAPDHSGLDEDPDVDATSGSGDGASDDGCTVSDREGTGVADGLQARIFEGYDVASVGQTTDGPTLVLGAPGIYGPSQLVGHRVAERAVQWPLLFERDWTFQHGFPRPFEGGWWSVETRLAGPADAFQFGGVILFDRAGSFGVEKLRLYHPADDSDAVELAGVGWGVDGTARVAFSSSMWDAGEIVVFDTSDGEIVASQALEPGTRFVDFVDYRGDLASDMFAFAVTNGAQPGVVYGKTTGPVEYSWAPGEVSNLSHVFVATGDVFAVSVSVEAREQTLFRLTESSWESVDAWPCDGLCPSDAAFADIDGDGGIDVVFGHDGRAYLRMSDGREITLLDEGLERVLGFADLDGNDAIDGILLRQEGDAVLVLSDPCHAIWSR